MTDVSHLHYDEVTDLWRQARAKLLPSVLSDRLIEPVISQASKPNRDTAGSAISRSQRINSEAP